MPSLQELRARFNPNPKLRTAQVRNPDESIVCDQRGQLTPKQHVESKVQRAMSEMDLECRYASRRLEIIEGRLMDSSFDH